jgi:hypothetical protein
MFISIALWSVEALFKILPLGVESKKDIGAQKMAKCILLKRRVAVLYPAVTRSVALIRMQRELPAAKATYTAISVKPPTGGCTSSDTGVAQAIQ